MIPLAERADQAFHGPGSMRENGLESTNVCVSLQSLHSPDSTLPDASHLSKWQCMGRFEPASL